MLFFLVSFYLRHSVQTNAAADGRTIYIKAGPCSQRICSQSVAVCNNNELVIKECQLDDTSASKQQRGCLCNNSVKCLTLL